jgi:hypothetical protein
MDQASLVAAVRQLLAPAQLALAALEQQAATNSNAPITITACQARNALRAGIAVASNALAAFAYRPAAGFPVQVVSVSGVLVTLLGVDDGRLIGAYTDAASGGRELGSWDMEGLVFGGGDPDHMDLMRVPAAAPAGDNVVRLNIEGRVQ